MNNVLVKRATTSVKRTKINHNICNAFQNIFRKVPVTFNNYLNSQVNILMQRNSATLTAIQKIFTIKKNTHPDISVKLFNLTVGDSSGNLYRIPPYLEIFKKLVYDKEWCKNVRLSHNHITELQTMLSKTITDNAKYEYLDNNKVGNVLGDVFYESLVVNQNLPTEILDLYPSLFFHKLLINDFTSWSVVANIAANMSHIAVVSFKYGGVNYDNAVYIFIDERTTSPTQRDIGKLAKDLVRRILFYNILLNTTVVPQRFILYLTDLEKNFDKYVLDHKHFKTNNVNSAVTNARDIVIYRKQELLKSIFHEMNHFHTMDFRKIPQDIVQHLIKTHNISPNNTYLLYESVTEALANVLNNVYLSRTLNEFKGNMVKEVKFSTLQVAKILKICGFNKWGQFSGDGLNNPVNQFKQDSCVFSYYVLKWYILMSLPMYMMGCLDMATLKFKNDDIAFANLVKIFDDTRKLPVVGETVDVLLKGKTIGKNNIGRTLRMTCL